MEKKSKRQKSRAQIIANPNTMNDLLFKYVLGFKQECYLNERGSLLMMPSPDKWRLSGRSFRSHCGAVSHNYLQFYPSHQHLTYPKV